MTARLHRRDEFGGAEDAAGADLGELHAGVGGRPAGFVPDGVAFAADDDVVARPGQHAQRNLVGHRAAGQPERRLLAEQGRDALLQRIDGRILAELVVTDGRGGDGRTHSGVGRVTVSERRSIGGAPVAMPPPALGRGSTRLIGGNLDKIEVGVAEIHRPDRPARAGFLHRALDDSDTAAFEMGNGLRQGNRRYQAEIGRAGRRRMRLGLEFPPGQVQVDFLAAEHQRLSPGTEGRHVHAEHARIERACSFDVAHRQHDVIDAIDVHRRTKGACWPEASDGVRGSRPANISRDRNTRRRRACPAATPPMAASKR